MDAQATRRGAGIGLPLRDQPGKKALGHLAGSPFFVSVRANETADGPSENLSTC